MATKKGPKPAATDDELSKLFEGIDDGSAPVNGSKGATTRAGRPSKKETSKTEQELLAELDSLAQQRPSSRPQTPKTAPSAAPAKEAPGSSRTSEEKKSGEETRSYHKSVTPGPESGEQVDVSSPTDGAGPNSSGGWWGSVFATASAAVKTAEAAVKEIQQNEEAKRWAEQVKGNVGVLREFGGELRSRAIPTFSTILHTIAPPISSHERLQIHITHDFIGYPSLDPLIYQTFSRVMAQVEGGDLMVIQRGQESSRRRGSDVGFTGSGKASWSDGPWWRQSAEQRNLSAVKGMVEGTKLVKVSAESYAGEYFASRGGVEEAARKAAEVLNESNPVRRSHIFMAIQAISHSNPEELFGGSAQAKQETAGVVEPEEKPEDLISFAIYLHDPIHGITFSTVTQSFPQKWIDWLDAPSVSATSSEAQLAVNADLPQEIAEIIASGGVDPREWVSEWVEEVLVLGTGVVAQRYVARRMGVGVGGLGRGKARQEAVESGGGEAARAI